jgi:hypothetical protein
VTSILVGLYVEAFFPPPDAGVSFKNPLTTVGGHMIRCIEKACGGLSVCSVQLPGDSPSSSNHNCLTVARIRALLFFSFPHYLLFPEEPSYHRNIDRSDVTTGLSVNPSLLPLVGRNCLGSHTASYSKSDTFSATFLSLTN